MEEQDYKQLVDNAAKNELLDQDDLEFLSSYFDKTLEAVVKDVLSRRITIDLAWMAGQHLN